MISHFIDTLDQQLEKLLAQSDIALPTGFKKSFHAVIQNTLSQLGMVSREEFDAQTTVLQRTRAKLELLEKQLAQLEAQAKNSI